MNRTVDVIVIGSGHNGLVAAAYLARAGWSVEVLERNPRPGGAVASEELTLPGFLHDTFSAWHPLFHLSAAYAELGPELAQRGLEYANADDVVTASVTPDGRAVLARRDPARTAEGLPGDDGPAYLDELAAFGRHAEPISRLMGMELRSWAAARGALGLARGLGRRETPAFVARVLASARAWLHGRFEHPDIADLLSPWVLHTGLTPDDAGGGFQLLALAGALHQVGLPIVRGGSGRFAEAFVRLIEDHGGEVRTGVEVQRIIVRRGRAAGVLAGDEEISARRAVIANVTPTQLYGTLLAPGDAPARAAARAERYRYNPRSGGQIHLALSAPLRWRGAEHLARVPVVHVTAGLDGTALACAQSAGGLLPAEPTIVCGQPTALDPGRAPDGQAIGWLQLQELPRVVRGDAAGEIDVGDGTWTPELAEAYADRVVARLARHVENLPEAVLGRAVLSPADIERRNVNLMGGDIYAGATDLSQSYLLRPLPGYGSHATPVAGLHQCGASTYPGPGLNAASGRIVALRLLRRGRAPAPLASFRGAR